MLCKYISITAIRSEGRVLAPQVTGRSEVVFDRNWKYIISQKQVVTKASKNNCGQLLTLTYTMPVDGYVLALTVNETPTETVWFDDIELLQQESLITQENAKKAWVYKNNLNSICLSIHFRVILRSQS